MPLSTFLCHIVKTIKTVFNNRDKYNYRRYIWQVSSQALEMPQTAF